MTTTMNGGVPDADLYVETANDRFKRSFSDWFWGSLIAATLIHFGVFALFPDLKAADMGIKTEVTEAINLPPEIEIPPPPQRIARPATPVVSAAAIDEDITIASTTFEDNPVEMLPPPPSATSSDDLSTFRAFTPDMVFPSLRNTSEVEQALKRYYPPLLRDAGIGGTVMVLFWIDENGRVVKHQVGKSSGYPNLDEAATKVADIMRFNPARNRDQPVRVVVQIPITFRVQ
ncbi:MAG TPA: energy transducer TonB [Longimicrobiales bacterium]